MKFTKSVPMIVAVLTIATALAGCFADDETPDTGPTSDQQDGQGDAVNTTDNETSGPILEESVSWQVGGSGCTTAGGLYLFAGALEGVDHAPLSLGSVSAGDKYEATIDATAPSAQWGVSFWGGDDLVGYESGAGESLAGTIPDRADRAIFWSCGGGMVQVDFVVTAEE